MSDTDTTTETPAASDKEANLAALRQQLEAANQKLAALEPLQRASVVREAGFDPDSPEGKALVRMVGDETDATKVTEMAAEIGWAPKQTLNPAEAATVAAAQAQDQLRQVSVGDVPADDIDRQIQEARESGNWQAAVILENRKLYGATTG